jgi:hypothetical protein
MSRLLSEDGGDVAEMAHLKSAFLRSKLVKGIPIFCHNGTVVGRKRPVTVEVSKSVDKHLHGTPLFLSHVSSP